MGRKPKTKSDSKPKKVSEEDESQPQEEIWDVVRVIEKNEECVCGTDGCEEPAVATWACNLDPEDKWDTCEGCQLKDFGGWPEGIDPPDDDEQETSQDSSSSTNEETPSHDREAETLQANEAFTPQGDTEASAGDDQQVETLMTVDVPVVEALDPSTTKPQENDDTASNNPSTETNAVETSSPKTDTDPEDDGEEIEVWELKKILSYADITKEATIKCSTETCTLPACSVWISNLAPTEKWYSCLDCQENDFEGWPALEELPVKRIETNHLEAIANKCSKQKSPQMPNFPSTSTTPARKQSNDVANFVTPPPNSLASMAPLQAKEGTGTGTGTATNAAKITPNPSANPVPNKPVSAGALASYKKWQQQAEALGGGRIVVSQPAAKKIIFDFLFDAFCPMNITQIFQGLKGVVPSAVLNSCLHSCMALDKHNDKNPFADSDDEDENKENKKTSTEPYAGSLLFKSGRNQSSNLYYVDHTKLKAMDREQREALAQNIAIAAAEEEALKETLKTTLGKTSQLLAEPTNEEAALRLEMEETALKDLEEKLDAARALKVNEKHMLKTKKRIRNMTAAWRKRKRLCMDFLISLEENTDGTVSAKKCLAGDGQIALDSDETVAKAAVQFAKEKRSKSLKGGLKGHKKGGPLGRGLRTGNHSKESDSLADELFVGVTLDSQGIVSRVYVNE